LEKETKRSPKFKDNKNIENAESELNNKPESSMVSSAYIKKSPKKIVNQ